MAIPIKGLDHVVLRIRDLDRSLGFYRDVLGLRVERELPDDIGLVQLRAGTGLIDLVPVESQLGRNGGRAPGPTGRNMDHFCIEVDPFDEIPIRSLLQEHGIECGETEIRYGARGDGPSIYIQDPDGNTVELKGPPTQTD